MTSTDPLSRLIEAACESAIKKAMNITDLAAKRLLTVEEAAAYLAISKREIYNMLANGELQAVRHGRRVMVDLRDAEKWIERKKS